MKRIGYAILVPQLMQVLSIFFAATFSELKEHLIVLTHRIFVLVFGLASGGLVCYFEGGLCKPTPFYYYIIKVSTSPVVFYVNCSKKLDRLKILILATTTPLAPK